MRFRSWLTKYWDLLLVLLLGLTPLLWYKEGLVIAGGDNYLLLNYGNLLNDFLHTWTARLNFGVPNLQTSQLFPLVSFWTFFNKGLGLSLLNTGRLWSVAVFTLTGLSMRGLVVSLLAPSHQPRTTSVRWGAATAAVLYMFNVWVMIDAMTPVMRVVAVFLPFFVLFWIRGLTSEKFSLRFPLSIGLLSLFLASTYAHLVSAVAIPLTFFFYLIFFLIFTKEFRRGLKMVFFSSLFFLIFNLWWLLPYFLSLKVIYPSWESAASSYNFLSATPIFDAFRFMGFWAFRSFDPVTHRAHVPYAHYYYELTFLFLSYVLSVLALVAVFFRPRDRRVIFFSFLGLLGVFLAKGASPPLGFFYQYLYGHLPGFAAFREPFARFTGVTVFSFSFLLGFTVSHLYNRMEARWYDRIDNPGRAILALWPLGILSAILALSFPILTGSVLQDPSWHGNTYDALRVDVPSYWKDLDSWLKSHNPLAKVLVFPRQPYGTCYRWNSGMCSAGPVAPLFLANSVFIYPESGFYYGDSLLKRLYDLMNAENYYDLSPLFSLLGVDYVLVQNDLVSGEDPSSQTHPKVLAKLAVRQNSLSLKKTFGKLDLYEYAGRNPPPVFSLPAKYELAVGEKELLPERLLLEGGRSARPVYFSGGKVNPVSPGVLTEAKTVFIDLTKEMESSGRQSFTFTVPQTGGYELFSQERGVDDNFPQDLTLLLDGEKWEEPSTEDPRAPLTRWGRRLLLEGKHTLDLSYRPLGNLVSEEGFFFGSLSTDRGLLTLGDSPPGGESAFWMLPDGPQVLTSFIPLKAVAPEGLYKVSFWYKNISGELRYFGMHENSCLLSTGKKDLAGENLFKSGCQNSISTYPLPSSSAWRYFEVDLEMKPTTRTAFLYFEFTKPGSEIWISSLRAERSLENFWFVENLSPDVGATEEIFPFTYEKVNPAKYYLAPAANRPPFVLVFHQSFSRHWKVYLAKSRPPSPFSLGETFFLKSLPESQHFPADGYANAWEIKEADVRSLGSSYEIIVEYQPQRFYLLGLSFLIVGLIFSGVYFSLRRNG